ncbi:MAG: DUF924 family protein [Candidatus Binataceae bacterium]
MEAEQRVAEILEFWFGPGKRPTRQRRVWFVPDPAFDQACTDGFLADYKLADAGSLQDWRNEPRSALALTLLFDQFPRNMFRGTARAFATDHKALALAKHAVARQFDLALSEVERAFVYLPFEHSENLDDQRESVRLHRQLFARAPAMAGYLMYAERHMEVIRRFGRFPHRNAILRRSSTPEEALFVAHGLAQM